MVYINANLDQASKEVINTELLIEVLGPLLNEQNLYITFIARDEPFEDKTWQEGDDHFLQLVLPYREILTAPSPNFLAIEYLLNELDQLSLPGLAEFKERLSTARLQVKIKEGSKGKATSGATPTTPPDKTGRIEIFKSKDGETSVEVTFDKETVWLNQLQLSELFGRDRTVIGRHIRNIFKEGELTENVVSADFAHTTQHGAIKGKYQQSTTRYYNLDVIISVGYRVKSVRGTQFRQWASQRLKEYLIRGYSVNEERLKQLKQSFQLLQTTAQSEVVAPEQIREVIDVLSEYALGLDILDGYDRQHIEIKATTRATSYTISYEEAKTAIANLRIKFGGSALFGNEKDASFKSSIAAINQTFAGQELYPSIEEKAAHLLYFVVKNHSFSDGNKRIAAWLFIWYLNKNDFLYYQPGQPRIANNALAALTLMVALSKPEEKELIIKVIISLINRGE